jgi:Flp pilus assembly protein TadD
MQSVTARPRAVPPRQGAAWLLFAVAVVALGATAPGCGTAWRGARLYSSGTHALDRGEVVRAIADLEVAAALLPDRAEVHNHLGIAYASAGRLDEAIAAFERAAALDCDGGAARSNLAAARARAAARAEDPARPPAARRSP